MSEVDPIEAWCALDENATLGPVHVGGRGIDTHDMRAVRTTEGSTYAWCALSPEREAHANARLIAADRNVRPELVALVRAAERRRIAAVGLRALVLECTKARRASTIGGMIDAAEQVLHDAIEAEDAALDAFRVACAREGYSRG